MFDKSKIGDCLLMVITGEKEGQPIMEKFRFHLDEGDQIIRSIKVERYVDVSIYYRPTQKQLDEREQDGE